MRRPLHLLALLLLVASCSVVTACGGDKGSGTTGTSATSTAESTPAAKKLKVGLVTDIGGLNDRSFNQLANEGLEKAKSELGIDGRVLTSKANSDYVPNLSIARPAEVRPRDRRRLPDGRGDGHRRLEVPGHQVRDHRRRRRVV